MTRKAWIIQSLIAFFRGILGFLASQPPAPAPIPPPRPQSIDDLLKVLNGNQVDQMADYLRNGGDPDAPLNMNARPVFFAHSVEMADLLIGAGADLNAINEFGSTAAHGMARDDELLPPLQRVVNSGADLGRLDIFFETPYDVAQREKAAVNAGWLESVGAPVGPVAKYRRQHPLTRKEDVDWPAGQTARMPSFANAIPDRSALWQHLRDLIQFWDPAVDWQPSPNVTPAALNSLAGIDLPAAYVEFFQSGIFDWLLWKSGQSGPYSLRCAWATADAIARRPVDEIIPVMQHDRLGLYCLERDELKPADPAVRYADCRNLANVDQKPPYSLHTGCRFSEFVAHLVYAELVELTPAQRSVDLESSREPQAIRLRQDLTRCALPRLRSGLGHVQHFAIYEGPNTLYVEIESPEQSQGYYGFLGGESDAALNELA